MGRGRVDRDLRRPRPQWGTPGSTRNEGRKREGEGVFALWLTGLTVYVHAPSASTPTTVVGYPITRAVPEVSPGPQSTERFYPCPCVRR